MTTPPLSISMDVRGLRLTRRVREHLDRGLERLDVWTRHFANRSCRVTIQRHQHDDSVSSQVVLEIPGKVIAAEDRAERTLAAVDRCLRKAARQLRDFKDRNRHPRIHRRVRSHEEALPQLVEDEVHQGESSHELHEFEARIGSHRERVRRFLAAESRDLSERIPELRVPVEDLVEETMMEALDGFGRRPWSLELGQWLDHLALDVLDRHLHELPAPTVDLDVEDDVPGVPTLSDHFGGLNRLLFRGEREEDEGGSSLEEIPPINVLASAAEDPAAAAEEADLESCIEELLRSIPSEGARAFRLHFLEGFDLQETAQILDQPEDRVRLALRRAEIFVRHRLGETASAS